jgi:probable F420-dependent oxidoreductase
MHLGAVLPQNELGHDTAALLAFAREADRLGFEHVLAYDHVLGADRRVHGDLAGPYGLDDTFHEPFILFGHLAATTRLGFATAILIAPQRPTALVAKQAAEVDLLADGRFRLGVGIGWNPVEYDALGQDFKGRGHRLSEQVTVLRRLWTDAVVDATIGDERIVAAGLRPLPVQRPIPIWMGGMAPRALERIGVLADGWFPMSWPGSGFEAQLAIVHEAAVAAGRDPMRLGIEGQVPSHVTEPARTIDLVGRWQAAGATHISINTLGQGYVGVDAHLDALRASAEAIGLRPRAAD